MVTVEEALKIVLSVKGNFGFETINLEDAYNRFLGEDIVADRDAPPFDRVMMDGIAIDSSILNLQKADGFFIEAIQAAGDAPKILSYKNNCIEVMTGAVLPINTDTVIPYESIEILHNSAFIKEVIIPKKNIHWQGSDHKKDTLALSKNKKITASAIGLLASIGISEVPVFKRPAIAIVATGNELVAVDKIPLGHQIRMSNVYSLHAALKADNQEATIFHISDEEPKLLKELTSIISEYDVVLISGGVSKGKYDFVPDILQKIGVEKLFHHVAQKPGKPFWFGFQATLKTHVFAFPGNPISTFVCYHFYFRQWFFASFENKLIFPVIPLSTSITPNNNLDQFIPVVLNNTDTEVIATSNNGSGDLLSLAKIDGFIFLPKGVDAYPPKSTFTFIKIV